MIGLRFTRLLNNIVADWRNGTLKTCYILQSITGRTSRGFESFHSAESLHFVASDASFSKLRDALERDGWQVDLTGVVTECPQHLEMPRPVHFQWDEHESTHMSEAVDWLDQHLCPVGVFALRAESCSWFKAAFGSICLNLHKTTVVFLLEEAKSAYNLDSLSENLMLMMLPFVVGLYELKTTKDLEERLSNHYSADSSSADPQEGSADKSSHPLLLPVSLNTGVSQQALVAVVVRQSLEIKLWKQDLRLICGLWHAHQHLTNCWGSKNLLKALVTLS